MSATKVFEFFVEGRPIPQGSKTGFVVTNKATGKSRAVVTDANSGNLKPWRAEIRDAARSAYSGDRLEGALMVVLEFRFLRPVSVKRERPTVKPDLDKLERAILDALTDSKTIRDDAQVVKVSKEKVYADVAGVHVVVGEYR